MEQILWFGWFRADIIAQYGALFWRGLQMTVLVTLIGIVFGTALGLGLGLAGMAESRHSPPMNSWVGAASRADFCVTAGMGGSYAPIRLAGRGARSSATSLDTNGFGEGGSAGAQ